ncbi:MAG: hypothetical protein H0V68_11420 [Actinobacteria bacterium]|nr:hypothetical protein [Actinomycetota bacterium]
MLHEVEYRAQHVAETLERPRLGPGERQVLREEADKLRAAGAAARAEVIAWIYELSERVERLQGQVDNLTGRTHQAERQLACVVDEGQASCEIAHVGTTNQHVPEGVRPPKTLQALDEVLDELRFWTASPDPPLTADELAVYAAGVFERVRELSDAGARQPTLTLLPTTAESYLATTEPDDA